MLTSGELMNRRGGEAQKLKSELVGAPPRLCGEESSHHSPTRIRWVLVVCITFMVAMFFVDRVNVSISGRSIAQDYYLTDVQLGKIFSAFFLGYALFQIPAGWVVDRLGPRHVLALGAVWWAAFTALTASFPADLAQAFLIIWSVRFLLGLGESVIFPSSNRWVANWIPSAERGLANGLIFAGVGGGSALAPPLVRYALVHLGWRAAFWGCGALGLLAAGGWYWMARDHPDQHSWLNDAERNWIHAGTPQRDPLDAPKLSWSTMLGSKEVWALTLSYFCFAYTPGIYFTWFFIYLTRVRGLNLQTASYYTMLPFMAMSLGSVVGGAIADGVCRRFGRWWGRCGVAALGLVGASLFLVAALRVSTAAAACVILAAGAGSLYLAQSAYWALSADFGKGSAGSLSGLMNMGAQLGIAVTAITTPLIAAHYGWTASFLTAAAFCVFGGALLLVINPNRSLRTVTSDE
jgi:ACS family glucarate transporter-like MFS transporter